MLHPPPLPPPAPRFTGVCVSVERASCKENCEGLCAWEGGTGGGGRGVNVDSLFACRACCDLSALDGKLLYCTVCAVCCSFASFHFFVFCSFIFRIRHSSIISPVAWHHRRPLLSPPLLVGLRLAAVQSIRMTSHLSIVAQSPCIL